MLRLLKFYGKPNISRFIKFVRNSCAPFIYILFKRDSETVTSSKGQVVKEFLSNNKKM